MQNQLLLKREGKEERREGRIRRQFAKTGVVLEEQPKAKAAGGKRRNAHVLQELSVEEGEKWRMLFVLNGAHSLESTISRLTRKSINV